MNHKDPYEILGVAKKASQDEIKRVYRRLAKQHHPDRNPGDKNAETRFKEIQAAYEVLGDSQRRAQYDQFGAGGPRPDFRNWSAGQNPFGGAEGFDFGSVDGLGGIFEQFFNRSGSRGRRTRPAPRRARPRGANLEYVVELTFEEMTRGAKREVQLSGDGAVERIEFRIPAGVADGQKIRVKDKGHDGPGGRGDLLITCRVKPHPFFSREGADILLNLPLSIAEAALGAKIEIPTLDGVTRVTVPAGTSSGARLRLRGKGIGKPNSADVGDMYAVIKIAAPKHLSKRALELLEHLDQELTHDPRADLGWPE